MMSIKDTRDNLAEVINQVNAAGDVFVITKFGKPKAMIVPIPNDRFTGKSKLNESFGAWRNRKDIKDSNKWVADRRAKMSMRYE